MVLFYKFKTIFGKNFNFINYKIFTLNFIQVFIEIFSIAFLIPLIQYLNDKQSIENYHSLITNFFDVFIAGKSIIEILFFLILIYSAKSILLLVINNSLLNCSRSLEHSLSEDLLIGYINSPLKKIFNLNSSIIVRNICGETGDVVSRYMQFINLITEILILTLIIILSFFVNVIFSIIVVTLFVFISSFYYLFLKNYIHKIGQERLDNASFKIKIVNELSDNFEFIKLSNKFSIFLDYFKKVNFKYLSSIKRMSLVNIFPRFFFEPVLLLLLIFNYYSSIILDLENSRIVENLLIFIILSLRIIPSINRILNSLNKIRYGYATIEAIYDEIKSFKKKLNYYSKYKIKKNFNVLNFKKISFRFEKKESDVLKNINFKIYKNDIIGLIGQSGSGKSTFLKLLMGFYQPYKGEIFLDNIEMINSLDVWQNSIGYVPQKSLLLDESILFNITLDRNINIKNNKHLKKIFEISSLSDFVPYSKLNKKIGERGSKISGGQAQRISIARALYNNPSTLILDEPTANLDRKTGIKILKNIKNHCKYNRIVIVTHNEKDLFICNKIFKIIDKKLKLYEK